VVMAETVDTAAMALDTDLDTALAMEAATEVATVDMEAVTEVVTALDTATGKFSYSELLRSAG
jgi:hypothetical protein